MTGWVSKSFLQLKRNLPDPNITATVSSWFRVDEAEIAKILEQVRQELPTTEAILVGKPQTGKSSIVRGLTGVSGEIVGHGYRPHTEHTQRYNFPTDALPLLTFTDTVGLGDGIQQTSEVIQELLGQLVEAEPTTSSAAELPDAKTAARDPSSAKVIIFTVKVTDFATATLREIAAQIRTQQPNVPCILAITCLHELYPPDQANHPTYPPDLASVQRAVEQIQKDFKGLYDRSILLDFTLEEDGFDPVFYGLDALLDRLSELLPHAESQAIAQLLDARFADDREVVDQLGQIYRDAARRYILPFSLMAGTLAAVPLPFATMPVLTAVQVTMVGLLGQLYGQKIKPSQAGGLVSAIAGGFLAQVIGRELVKFIPIFGSVVAASWATAYTWSLGEAACVYFGDLMGGRKPDSDRIHAVMKTAFAEAQQRFKSLSQTPQNASETER
ncbi:50S ribosome-binding GTPase [filamentous cyanobacterium LEGE 11480]|uniref:50S ribosome-binding GTPase n=2 Tax=Romeriopsis TaxID=2992131 RepID=A0A928Z604_9CYAN|nr:50S ribosome-binding GTPase [Romeriopsis navalis LEGE 11480]